jgi:phenylpropionate dioxygenase-like ring-hydroxylating dioxygenase large terminal subunit
MDSDVFVAIIGGPDWRDSRHHEEVSMREPRPDLTDDPAAPIRGLGVEAYRSIDVLEAERVSVFRRSWQLVCHSSELPAVGSHYLFELLGDSVLVVRDESGDIHAFHNVCRHRGSRLVDTSVAQPAGEFRARRILCPYHAWCYGLDGRLRHLPDAASYGAADRSKLNLKPVRVGLWQGFLFVALEDPGRPLTEWLAPLDAEIGPYRLAEMRPLGRITLRPRRMNWKVIVENYLDSLHVPVAHPGLAALTGDRYRVDMVADGIFRMQAEIEAGVGAGLSERLYCAWLPEQGHLPETQRRSWRYYLLWPNTALDIYPDQIDFMQMLPLDSGRTLIREVSYGLPDGTRQMRVTRYLNWRINRQVNAEDTTLISRVWAGLASGVYDPGPISAKETCLAAFTTQWRRSMRGAPCAAGL